MAFYMKKEKQSGVIVENNVNTTIGVDTEIQGNINSNEIIKINGKYKGDMYTSNDILIGESGYVKGNIKANKVSISGVMEGNVVSFELLDIKPTGKLIGNIQAKNISIAQGAIFKGKSTMIDDIQDIDLIDDLNIDEMKDCDLEENDDLKGGS